MHGRGENSEKVSKTLQRGEGEVRPSRTKWPLFQNLETSHAFVKVFRAHKADSEPTPAAAKAGGRPWRAFSPTFFQPEIHMEVPISCTPHADWKGRENFKQNVAKCDNPETSVSSRREANFRNQAS